MSTSRSPITESRQSPSGRRCWCEDLLESTGELDKVPEHLRPYFDVEAYARDLELNGDVFTVEDGISIHVFWGR